jgi:hypothetical protein
MCSVFLFVYFIYLFRLLNFECHQLIIVDVCVFYSKKLAFLTDHQFLTIIIGIAVGTRENYDQY